MCLMRANNIMVSMRDLPHISPDVFGRLVLQMPRHDSKCLLPFSTMQCRIILNLDQNSFRLLLDRLGIYYAHLDGRKEGSITLQTFQNLILIRITYLLIRNFRFDDLKQNKKKENYGN